MIDDELIKNYKLSMDEIEKVVNESIKQDQVLKGYNEFYYLKQEELEEMRKQKYRRTIVNAVKNKKITISEVKKILEDDYNKGKISKKFYISIIEQLCGDMEAFKLMLSIDKRESKKIDINKNISNISQVKEEEKGEER